jgi:hypothetical protein
MKTSSNSAKPKAAAKKLTAKIVQVGKIGASLRKEMFALFEMYYVDVEFARFERDLSEKTHVFLFYDRRTKELVGFSTIYRKRMPEIAPGLFLFSGDTVLREDCWGSKILQQCFHRYIVASKLMTPHQPLYWMLMSKGFKTYMMARMNFKRSYPNYRRPTPELFQRVLDRYYGKKFGSAYDPETGLITFPKSLGAVKGGFADPTEKQLKDPDIRYFLKRNPDYRDGVELACVTEIQFRDFVGHVPKFFLKLGGKKK